MKKIHITDAISEFKKERKNTRSIENNKHKVLKDIFDIWDVADVQKGGAFIFQFVASNPNRLPSVNADKFNLQFLISCMLIAKTPRKCLRITEFDWVSNQQCQLYPPSS